MEFAFAAQRDSNGRARNARKWVVESGWHSIALLSAKTDDYHLERIFQLAANNAPSLIVLEDSDGSFGTLFTDAGLKHAMRVPTLCQRLE